MGTGPAGGGTDPDSLSVIRQFSGAGKLAAGADSALARLKDRPGTSSLSYGGACREAKPEPG
jgi:hypothetical protein